MMTDYEDMITDYEESEKPRRKKWRLSIAPFLTLFFTLLKVTGIIDWSWWWVFSPLWLPLLLILIGIVALIIISIGIIIYRIIKL
jgi:hypothetical protein